MGKNQWTKRRPKKNGIYRVKCDEKTGTIEVVDGYAILGNVTKKRIDGAYFDGCEFVEEIE